MTLGSGLLMNLPFQSPLPVYIFWHICWSTGWGQHCSSPPSSGCSWTSESGALAG